VPGSIFTVSPVEEAPAPAEVISNLGFREHWQGFFLYGEKIGFSHFGFLLLKRFQLEINMLLFRYTVF